MNLSMTTDYVTYIRSPQPYLRRIAEAGFTHVHWCHEWNTAHVYSMEEIVQIGEWLRQYGLRLLDLHAPHGREQHWGSDSEDGRSASVARIRNRLEMTAHLAGQAIVLHLPPVPTCVSELPAYWTALRRSMDELLVVSRKTGIRIALENMVDDDFLALERCLAEYGSDRVGLCYDSGHGNIGQDGLGHLDRHRDRLISVHLHDNDGKHDQHNVPFTGAVDWPRLAKILAGSSYRDCVSMESNMRGEKIEEAAFLQEAHQAGERLTELIARQGEDCC